MSNNNFGLLSCPRCRNDKLVSEVEPATGGVEVTKRKCPSCFTSFYLAEDILAWMSQINAAVAQPAATTTTNKQLRPATGPTTG